MKALKYVAIVACVASTVVVASARAASFTPGNLVIYRVGDGTTDLVNTGNAVFLDEYTPSGTLVQSVAMPTVASGANHALFASGTAQTEGLLTLSADGQYLLLTGYANTTTGTTSLKSTKATDVNRVIGRVDSAGNVDTSTALTDFCSKDTIRSAASTNGTDLWVTGNTGGVAYTTLGATTSVSLSTSVTSGYQVNIFNGQLYVTTHSNSKLLAPIGTGVPTTAGQTITSPLTATNGLGNPDAFCFLDLDSATPGVDTLYLADDATGLMKYCYSGDTWVYEGSQGTGTDGYRGLTGAVDSLGNVILYATRNGGGTTTGGGELVAVSDTSGFNATMTASFTTIATAASYTAFRGVAFAPTSVPEPSTMALLTVCVLGLSGLRLVRRK
jgi:hypothetical protein